MIALTFLMDSLSGKWCREAVHSKDNKITESKRQSVKFRTVKAAGIHVAENELQIYAQSSSRVHCQYYLECKV